MGFIARKPIFLVWDQVRYKYWFKPAYSFRENTQKNMKLYYTLQCALNILTTTTTESRSNIWYQQNVFKPLGGLGCCPFLYGGSVVVGTLFIVAPVVCGDSVCYVVLSVLFSFEIILTENKELVALPGVLLLLVFFSSSWFLGLVCSV